MGRRIAVRTIESRVRQKRAERGLSQVELSQRTGLSRQTVSAIEAGQYVPNTAVALRLAQVLGCSVEDLFQTPAPTQRVTADLVSEVLRPEDAPQRVQLARVGGRLLALPLAGFGGVQTAADGIAAGWDATGAVSVELAVDSQLPDRTAVVLGCDPALTLLGSHVARRYPSLRLLTVEGDSMAALRAVRRGEAHAGGIHLYDHETGEHNLPFVRRELSGRRTAVVNLSEWQQGLIVQRGNPKGIRGAADLTRADVSIVNRARGAGTRALLDSWLATAGVNSTQVRGYEWELPSHMAVAAAVAWRAGDAGPGIMSAARAFELDFIPLQYERFDLVVPAEFLDTPPIQALLEIAVSPGYRSELEALGGYDTSRAGAVIAELG